VLDLCRRRRLFRQLLLLSLLPLPFFLEDEEKLLIFGSFAARIRLSRPVLAARPPRPAAGLANSSRPAAAPPKSAAAPPHPSLVPVGGSPFLERGLDLLAAPIWISIAWVLCFGWLPGLICESWPDSDLV
jgi:hypothetical protein